jgi:hypothetical protein
VTGDIVGVTALSLAAEANDEAVKGGVGT